MQSNSVPDSLEGFRRCREVLQLPLTPSVEVEVRQLLDRKASADLLISIVVHLEQHHVFPILDVLLHQRLHLPASGTPRGVERDYHQSVARLFKLVNKLLYTPYVHNTKQTTLTKKKKKKRKKEKKKGKATRLQSFRILVSVFSALVLVSSQ